MQYLPIPSSVVFFSKPVVWDEEGNTVNLIMLLHVGKNNVQAFQMWNYFSKIFASKELVEQLREKPDFEHFIYLIKKHCKMESTVVSYKKGEIYSVMDKQISNNER